MHPHEDTKEMISLIEKTFIFDLINRVKFRGQNTVFWLVRLLTAKINALQPDRLRLEKSFVAAEKDVTR